jgi:hypothetical protein
MQDHPHPPPSRRAAAARRAGLAFLLGALATLAFLALGTRGLDEDGPGFVRALAYATGPVPYHHAGYLELARWAALLWFDDHTVEALLFTSAWCGGMALGLLALLVLWRAPMHAALPLVAAFACAPALWLQSTRVELHSAQLLGGVLVLVAAEFAVGRAVWVRALALCGAACLALPLHATNALLLPGAVWLAARVEASGPRVTARAFVAAGLGGALGALFGSLLNGGSTKGPAELSAAAGMLLERFVVGPSLGFLWSELIVPWSPVLAIALAVVALHRRGRAAAWPHLAAAAPGLLLFTFYGVPTGGGYATSCLAAVALGAAACAGRDPRPRPRGVRALALVAATACAVGTVGARAVVTAPERAAREAAADARFALVRELLPRGGWILGVLPFDQIALGRDRRWADLDLSPEFTRALWDGVSPSEFAAAQSAVIAGAAARGVPIALDESWRVLAPAEPRLEPLVQALYDLVEQHYETERVVAVGREFLVGSPRAAGGASAR